MSATRRISWFTPERRILAGLLLFTLLVRSGVLWVMRGNLQSDPDAYREIAENLLRHGEFALGQEEPEGRWGRQIRPTAYRPPLYPVVLSNLPTADGEQVSLVKVALLHLGLGVGTVWLTWLTARRLFRRGGSAHHHIGGHSPPYALLAGLLVACDPILLNQQTLVMTETLAAFLAILSLWCLARFDDRREWFNAALAGVAIGLAVLCRPTFLPWLFLVGAGVVIVRQASGDRGVRSAEPLADRRSWWSGFGWRVANAFALVIAAAVVMSPWVIRNYQVFGKPIVTTTHGGYTLLLGNNQYFYDWLQRSSRDTPWNSEVLDADLGSRGTLYSPEQGRELSTDRFCHAWAMGVIREQSGQFIRACFYRLRQLWSPLPYKLKADESMGRRLLRYATAAWYSGVYFLAAVGVWRLRWKLLQPPWIWGVLLCLAFSGVHTFYWTNLRMRAPLMPFVAIVAAAAFVHSPTSRSGPDGAK